MRSCIIAMAVCASVGSGHAAEEYAPRIAAASNEGREAIRKFRIPDGLTVELVAAEPLLANPVAFAIDPKGRFYVCETFRHYAGVTDDRRHVYWIDDDLASRTVEDRVAMYQKWLKDAFAGYTTEHDRVRLVTDADGDGTADTSTVFADGFKSAASGIGAGVLPYKGDVYYTCIPDLWKLRDNNGDGKADERTSLAYGFGVHVAFLGHDMHGLKVGPDGKLYFTIGDRGLNVKTADRSLVNPDSGAVLRCNFDGSEMELVHTGLRNPQEIAFDDFGNLFTVDNNSDGGDKARLVQIVEGGDSGWRIGWQFIEQPTSRGPWNAERMWEPRWDGQPAHLLPPLANISDGPSGLTYYPGHGLDDRYKGHFFLADFRGGSGQSGIRSFAVKPAGASFALDDSHEFLWSVLATDVDFGYDGAMYLSDWIEGWDKPTKGRIYRVFDPKRRQAASVVETKKLMAEGIDGLPLEKLVPLLAAVDGRVRLEAQLALAAKGMEAAPWFAAVAAKPEVGLIGRLHAVWGLGILGRQSPEAFKDLLPLLKDREPEIRAQVAKVVGDAHHFPAYGGLVAALKDENLHVQFYAAQALGKLGQASAVPTLVELLERNADKDAYLRHAAVFALTRVAPPASLAEHARHSSRAVRLGALLALRKLGDPAVAAFLADDDRQLVAEAARAINDGPIDAATPALAALSAKGGELDEPTALRVLNANARVGTSDSAAAIASFAVTEKATATVRLEAVRALAAWPNPSGRDRVTGLWRPIGKRDAGPAADALKLVAGKLLASGSDPLRLAALDAVAALGVAEARDDVAALVKDAGRSGVVRAKALDVLNALPGGGSADVVEAALSDKDAAVRSQARRLYAKVAPDQAIPVLAKVLEEGSAGEKQAALLALATVDRPAADDLLARWMDRLAQGTAPPEVQLELLAAAGSRSAGKVKEQVAAFEKKREVADPATRFAEVLAGGDAERGRQIFFERAEASCLRCHKVNNRGGEVGPELSGIAKQKDRRYLLESIVDPNKAIAQNFETVVLETSDGTVHVGVLKGEDDKAIRLVTPKAEFMTVAKADVETRARGKSAMPEDLYKHLSRADLRDLVEYLASLKGEDPAPRKTEE